MFFKSKPFQSEVILDEVFDKRWHVTGKTVSKYDNKIVIVDLEGEEKPLSFIDKLSPEDWCGFEGLGRDGIKQRWRQMTENAIDKRAHEKRWVARPSLVV